MREIGTSRVVDGRLRMLSSSCSAEVMPGSSDAGHVVEMMVSGVGTIAGVV